MDISQLMDFVGNHLLLATALMLTTALLVGNEIMLKLRGFQAVIPATAVQLINQQNAQVLDVRDASAFNKGHIANAFNTPLDQLVKSSNGVKADKSQPVIVACESGQTANRAAVLLKAAGFTNLYTLKGGITTWREDKLPLTRK